MLVLLLILAVPLVVGAAVVILSRRREGDVDDPRVARVAAAEAERTRSAGYFCAHLPIDNPRVSGAGGL